MNVTRIAADISIGFIVRSYFSISINSNPQSQYASDRRPRALDRAATGTDF